MSDRVIYTVGGTVQAGGGVYIVRDADGELLESCHRGEYCYVLTARQMGKSSLMVATIERLATEGIRSVEIDLTAMGGELSGLTAEQWYLGLVDFIVDQLELDIDHIAWWNERVHLGPVQRWRNFLRKVVLEQLTERLVIFIDEIDYTLNLEYSDDFFAAIRSFHNVRASDPTFKRLSFVLLGVATPSDLISDPQQTPFNIGRRIELTDFTESQAAELAAGLNLPPVEAEMVIGWLLDWTDGHPYLTQRLCAAAATSPTKEWNPMTIQRLVEKTFLGEQSSQDSNLQFVRDMLTKRAPDKAAVLKIYRQIYNDRNVSDEERSLVKSHLKLSGVVKPTDGYLHIRNKIYRRGFDSNWVRANAEVNWPPIVASIAIFLLVLVVGFFAHNVWVENQVSVSDEEFYKGTPAEQREHLARIFEPPGLWQVTDSDHRGRELFFGLSRAQQLEIFYVSFVNDPPVVTVVKGLYVTLADTEDDAGSTSPLLEAMAEALKTSDEAGDVNNLKNEISHWLEARKLYQDEEYDESRAEYDNAIGLYGDNPATLYERARVLIRLGETNKALEDCDHVMAIAGRSPNPTSTPTPGTVEIAISQAGTIFVSRTPPPKKTLTLIPSTTPIPTPLASLTPTPELSSFKSEFTTAPQILTAVRRLIDANPELRGILDIASSTEYANLREYGLMSTYTPTPYSTARAIVVEDRLNVQNGPTVDTRVVTSVENGTEVILIPTYTPTPYTTARVTIEEDRVNVRERQTQNSRVLETLENGTEIIILARTSDGEWFQVTIVKTPSEPLGWVAADLITLDDSGEYGKMPTVSPIPSSPPPPTAKAIRESLGPGESKHYEFTGDSPTTTWVLLFRPDVNNTGKRELLEFIISEDGRSVGRGSLYIEPPRDVKFGGLIWVGGTPGLRYRLDINNKSSKWVEWCLVPKRVHSWVCHQ